LRRFQSGTTQLVQWYTLPPRFIEKIKLFATLKTEDKERSIGPWWLENLEDEQAAVDKFALVYTLDLYRSRVRGLDELDSAASGVFVNGLYGYQQYIRMRHSHPQGDYAEILKKVADLFEKIINDGRASALVYSYLGSVRSLQNEGNAAIAAYERATEFDPTDVFAAHALKRFREAQALKPVPVAESPAGRLKICACRSCPVMMPQRCPLHAGTSPSL
jgi:tetratricopeptide (TPR) repeat protein